MGFSDEMKKRPKRRIRLFLFGRRHQETLKARFSVSLDAMDIDTT